MKYGPHEDDGTEAMLRKGFHIYLWNEYIVFNLL